MSTFVQNCGFLFPEGDTINGFKLNVACKCRPWVCLLPNLAQISKGDGQKGSFVFHLLSRRDDGIDGPLVLPMRDDSCIHTCVVLLLLLLQPFYGLLDFVRDYLGEPVLER